MSRCTECRHCFMYRDTWGCSSPKGHGESAHVDSSGRCVWLFAIVDDPAHNDPCAHFVPTILSDGGF